MFAVYRLSDHEIYSVRPARWTLGIGGQVHDRSSLLKCAVAEAQPGFLDNSPHPARADAPRARQRAWKQPESPAIEPVAAGALPAPESHPDEPRDEEDDGGDPQHVEGKSRTCEYQDQQQCEQNKHWVFPSIADLTLAWFFPGTRLTKHIVEYFVGCCQKDS